MEIKFMENRIIKLMKILFKIAIMGLIIAGIILINKKYMNNAEGSEKIEIKNVGPVSQTGLNKMAAWKTAPDIF